MAKEKAKSAHLIVRDNQWGWILFTAYIGALIYFIQHSHGFWQIVLAFLKAAVWPAYVLHAVLNIIGA